MFRGRRVRSVDGSEDSNFWIPYSDVMAGLLGLFALMLVVAVAGFGAPLEKVRDVLEAREAVAKALQAEFEADPRVEVTEGGAVRLSQKVLFGSAKWKLTREGEQVLLDVMPRYLSAVRSRPLLVDALHRVRVEGHADPRGRYMYNLELSQKRAASVVRLLVDSLEGHRDFVRKNFVASGRSNSDLIYVDAAHTEVDSAASRRIQIDMVLKDQELIDGLMQIFRSLGMRVE